jgi:hypothetical protein
MEKETRLTAQGRRASVPAALCGIGMPGPPLGRRHRVLDGQIDAHAADGRHGVGRVSDAQEPRPIPPAQAVYRHRQELDVVPAPQGS